MKKVGLILIILSFLLGCSKKNNPDSITVNAELPEKFKEYIITQSEVKEYCKDNSKCKTDSTGDFEIEGFNQFQIRECYWIINTVKYKPETKEVFEDGVLMGYLDWNVSGAKFEPLETKRGAKK